MKLEGIKMQEKQKRMGLIFAMAFVATAMIMVVFLSDSGDAGKAIAFDSVKQKSNLCEKFCDEEMQKESTLYTDWTLCHENCMKKN
ncbi:hypothetical protein KKG83_00805 [Candidatus Micrarchaeota archaeon]|nr:hypothetical protein [Candidatus Micrarchaeota archaeon]MBU2475990.1 hypothetical protein [Candidatus Micrarchaeota archaeon]